MRKYLLILAFLAFPFTQDARTSQKGDPFEALHEGIERHSDSLMREFFESWYHASEPLRKTPTTNLQKDAEGILEALSDPAQRNAILWGSRSDSIVPKPLPPYVVLWPIVEIYSDSINNGPADSLENMFPPELFGAKTLVYMKNYVDSVERYFRSWGSPNRGYVAKFTALSCHEMGCGILLEPVIPSIRFSDGNTVAIVRYAMDEEVWDYTLTKVSGKWKATKSLMKSIE